MEFYKVFYSNEYAKKKCKFGIIEVFPEPYDEYLLSDNEPFPFEMLKNTVFKLKDGLFADKQMSYYPWRLISEKFKILLEGFVLERNEIYFHPIIIDSLNESSKEQYYIMHFNKTIDFEEDENQNIDTRLQMSKYHFQAFNDSITGTFFVSKELMNILKKEKITGIDFSIL